MNIRYYLFAFLFFLASCEMEPKNYTEEIARMEDTLFASFPSTGRVSIEVRRDFGTELIITLGDATMYHQPDAVRADAAGKIARIALAVFTPEKLPKKGRLIVVEEENTIVTDKDTWKISELPLEPLLKK